MKFLNELAPERSTSLVQRTEIVFHLTGERRVLNG